MKSLSISNQEKLNIVDSLATLLASGIPIIEAVESLLEEAKGDSLKILKILEEDLNQGKTIAYSLTRHPKSFDPITVNLIKAAEESGTLETTLKDITESIAKDIDFIGKVRGGLIYPSIILFIMYGYINLALFFVIPKFSEVIDRLKYDVPLPTKILFGVSKFANDNLLLVITAQVLAVLCIVILFKTKKSFIARLFFSLPLISKLVLEIDITRFTRSLSLLLKSGIPIDEAIRLSKDVVGKKEIRDVITDSLKQVESGKTISSGLKKHKGIIPGFMVRITQAGEKSGTLENALQQISNQFETRVTNRLKSVTLLIEPILLITVALMVGALLLAIVAPIYNLIGKFSQR